MTNGQVIVAAFVLIGFFAVVAGLIVAAGLLLNDWMYRWEQRHEHPELVERCNVYRLHPPQVDEVRPRRGSAA